MDCDEAAIDAIETKQNLHQVKKSKPVKVQVSIPISIQTSININKK